MHIVQANYDELLWSRFSFLWKYFCLPFIVGRINSTILMTLAVQRLAVWVPEEEMPGSGPEVPGTVQRIP